MSSSLSPSSLQIILSTDVSSDWPATVLFNTNRLNTTLLKLSNMGDVSLTDLEEGDGLKWDEASGYYINENPITTTTTTTSSTSSSTTTSSSSSTTSTTAYVIPVNLIPPVIYEE